MYCQAGINCAKKTFGGTLFQAHGSATMNILKAPFYLLLNIL